MVGAAAADAAPPERRVRQLLRRSGQIPALSTRAWTCPGCRTRHDRDVNAAKNILAAGRAVTRDNSGDACGAGARQQGSSLPQSAMKQEAQPVRAGIPLP
ncbi:zinc ribbon domain-containing protein [Nonomuraea diastatica]|uniref:zinc ribbon domain-containing protein n=1 Tax=Nonomuraea diastatica TaxID=1848329 RepID=UPI00140DDF2D|nr:zinc ribbon domain-containing protein [Nonomuraea diastatica]